MESEIRLLFVAFRIVSGIAVLATLLIIIDVIPRLRAAHQRRRREKEGAFGVVIDEDGEVLGVYRDPFAPPTRAARLLSRESPWTRPGPHGRPGWAWEGMGATEEEARNAAQRQRRLYLLLRPELDRVDRGEPGPPC